jgi:hypothetical protein
MGVVIRRKLMASRSFGDHKAFPGDSRGSIVPPVLHKICDSTVLYL